MTHFLRLLARTIRFWWLTITLPRQERRSQAIWEAAQGTEPPPFEGVPSPMGYVALRGLWPNWETVSRVSAAHNRRVDEWIKEHVDYRPETIVLEPDTVVRVVPPQPYNTYLENAAAGWGSTLGNAAGAFTGGIQARRMLARQERDEMEAMRQRALHAARDYAAIIKALPTFKELTIHPDDAEPPDYN